MKALKFVWVACVTLVALVLATIGAIIRSIGSPLVWAGLKMLEHAHRVAVGQPIIPVVDVKTPMEIRP